MIELVFGTARRVYFEAVGSGAAGAADVAGRRAEIVGE